MNFNDYIYFMNKALLEAKYAYNKNEVPVGAVIVNEDGMILGSAHNNKESTLNPCAHAEILSIIKAADKIKDWRLNDSIAFVTLEPCFMCLGAMIQSRIGKLIFGAYDYKGGSISLGYNFINDYRLNHNLSTIGGILQEDCSLIISKFFKEKR